MSKRAGRVEDQWGQIRKTGKTTRMEGYSKKICLVKCSFTDSKVKALRIKGWQLQVKTWINHLCYLGAMLYQVLKWRNFLPFLVLETDKVLAITWIRTWVWVTGQISQWIKKSWTSSTCQTIDQLLFGAQCLTSNKKSKWVLYQAWVLFLVEASVAPTVKKPQTTKNQNFHLKLRR